MKAPVAELLEPQVDSNSSSTDKLPILIVAYCRAALLEKMLVSLKNADRRIYLAIDRAPESLSHENQQVIECAQRFLTQMQLQIHVNKTQAGVKFGVPQAMDWVFEFENRCIILEDDCVASEVSLTYFDRMSQKINGNIALIAGDSPWSPGERLVSSLSSFPLIWGWCTTKTEWHELRSLIGGKVPVRRIASTLLTKPMRLLDISFFLAAQIRISKGFLQAWDCSVALEMLLSNKKCIVPNVRLIENIGYDEFAHHTLVKTKLDSRIENSSTHLSTFLESTSASNKLTDRRIRKAIYKMKWFNIFAPAKALFILK